ncbi:MAG: hypothetical protein IPN55_11975 [Saprospiraceae bacterium]|nr:hypothetical protein [Candidatus Brachybacter algidus]
MKYLAFISFLLFAMCSNDNSKQVSDSENQNTSVEAIDKEENKQINLHLQANFLAIVMESFLLLKLKLKEII